MKKVTALAGALLLSSSLVAGCTQSAAPNRTGNNYDTTKTGRVQDIGNRVGVGVRGVGQGARNLTNNATNNATTNATNNLRVDRTLEARVETIPGIKDAKVLVAGNTAYVAVNQGTNLQGKAGTTSYNNTTRDRYTNNAVGGTYRGGVGTNTGTYGTAGTAGTAGTPGTLTGTTANRPGAGVTYGTYGTAGTYGTPGTYGTTYGTNGTTGTYGTTGGYSGTNGIYGNAGAGNMTSYGTNTYTGNTGAVHPGSYSIRNNGVYGATNGLAGYGNSGAGIMSGTAGGSTYALDTNRQGYGNYYNAGTQTYGTTGTAGNTVAPYGTTGNNVGTYSGPDIGRNAGIVGTNPGVTGRAGTMAGGTGTTYNTTGKGSTAGTTTGTGTHGYGSTTVNPTTGTGRNAGTMGGGTNAANDNVSADVKARVTAAIKQANPSIQNVYVTANPAVTNRIGAFVRDTGTGHPLRGANDLLDTLRRMFPASR